MAGPSPQTNFRLTLTRLLPVRSVSGDVEALLGFSREDFLTAKVRLKDRIHPEDADIAASLFSLENQSPSGSVTLRIRHADGHIRVLRGQFKRERSSRGEAHLDLLLEDVRGLHEPGDAFLVTSFKSLIEQASDYVYVKNRNHVMLAASRTVAHVTQSAHDSAELVGKTDYDLHTEEVADIGYRLEKLAMAEGRRINHIQQLVAQDGRLHWIDNRKYPVNGPEGEVIGIFGIAPDITAYIEAELKLRESEEVLRESQEIAGLGSYSADLVKRTWESSEIMDRVFGIDEKYSHTVKGWLDLIHPEDRPAVAAYFEDEVLGKGKSFDRQYRIVRPSDRAVRWVNGVGRLVCDEQGRPVKLLGVIQDITERKQAETELQEHRELLQLFIEHAPVALAMFDCEMRYLAVSRRWAEDHGIDARQIVGRSHYEVNPDVTEAWKETHRRGREGEAQRVEEDRYDRADGTTEWIRWQIIPWRAAHGSIGGIVMFYEDITDRKQAEAALRQSKELLQLFIERAPAALAMFDREMRYLAVSRRWIEENSLAGIDVLGQSHYDVVRDVPEHWKEAHRRGLAGETLKADEERFDRADGTVQWIRWEVTPWRAADGSVGGIVLFVEDITQQKEIEDRLRLAATVFTSAREGIVITDPSGTILEVNEAFSRITGYSREEVLGRNPRMLKSGLQSKELYENMWNALTREGEWSGEIWNRAKNGNIYAEMLSIHAMYDAGGQIQQYVGHFTDITAIKEHELQLEHMANFDALTGLPNRALFADRLRQAMAQEQRRHQFLAVAYFDLDNFKQINDRYGHATGDGLLTAMAFRMKRAMREGDTLARLAGDEFAAVLLDLPDAKACGPMINGMLKAASEEAQIGEFLLRASASAGVAFYPQAEEVDADGLLRQAGQALYQAKLAGGKRCCYFDPSQDILARSRHENLEHVRQALAERQFVLHYQPKVNMRTGEVVGAETLIRWEHPERGLLPPGMFLPLIENDPLVIELGAWAIESALAQLETWQAAGLNLPVSVNVSALELQQPGFAERLRAQLAAHPGIKPSQLELEVLETGALHDLVQSSRVLTTCSEIGVSISLDDFGTGYSSLTYLQRLPANVLKIDQSFVRGLLDEPDSLTILEGMMGLAAAFRRQVIAEGVETIDLGLMLLQMGCEFAQGYAIARPMPAQDLPEWAAHWRPDPRWAAVPPVHPENREVLYASVEHRAWIGAFEACLQGRRATPPPLDAGQCRIGAWLKARRRSARGALAAIQAIELLHQELHDLAAEIHGARNDGRNEESLKRLRQLQYLQDRCLKRLETFARASTGKSGSKSSRHRDGRAAASPGAR